MQSDIHRIEYWSKLIDWLNKIGAGVYKKNRTDMYQVLRPFMDVAIANADRDICDKHLVNSFKNYYVISRILY